MSEIFNEKTIFWMLLGLAVFIILYVYLHRKRRFKFKGHVIFQQKIKQSFMASQDTLTLKDTNVHTGLIVMEDNDGNTYTGTIANVVLTPSDPTQDNVVTDPTTPSTIDVNALTPSGGATVNMLMDFTSQGNTTSRPNPDPTKPPSKVIPDGQVFTGVPGKFTLINNLPTTLQLTAHVNF